jgi:light-regulated signal transduction histidine kinase (bacteriophytochrome)
MEVGLGISAIFQFAYYSRKTELELESSNQQMMLQTNELKRSNADLEQFAYVISHDLKTPVRNISCFMQLLSNKHAVSLDTEAREFVDFAVNGSKRMERLIDDVLAYSRIGRNLSTPTPVNVNDVINTIRYEQEGKQDTSYATINITNELPIVNSAHSSLLYHIFQNLIRNGLKFNKSEHPEINISFQDTEQFYVFSVADNGIGIPKKYAAQVFQMFKRLHNENEYDGTGIGLAICKKIVEHYNGEIWYESDGSDGTTFCFTIRKF